MRPIKDIPYLDNARNAEHWYLVMQLLEILTAEFAAKYGLTSRLAKAKAVFERENAAFKTEVGYEDTISVNEADLARDKVYRRIKATAHMAELSDDAEVAAAAARLLKRILEASGDVTRAPQGEATAIYADIVEKLQSDIYAADVTAIGATADVALLKEANDAFHEIYVVRTDSKLARSSAEKIDDVRIEMNEEIRWLVDLLNALYLYYLELAPDAEALAEVKVVTDQFNARIAQYRETLSRRGLGAVTPIEGEEGGDPTDPEDPGTTEPTDPTEPGGEGGSPGGV